jgi:hypothetical protein
MADNMQLPPTGGQAGNSTVAAQPGRPRGRAGLTAVLLVVAGALLGLAGGAIWAAAAPRVIYQVYALNPPTAFATNVETSAFIATDGVYTFIALGGGALLGLAGYLAGVRRYGPVPMAGIVLGAVAAAFLAKWLGPVLTGQGSFNAQLGASHKGALLRAPIALGATGALAFWPVAAGLVAGGLELSSVLRVRQVRPEGGAGPGPGGPPFGRHAQSGRRGLFRPRGTRPGQDEAGQAQFGPVQSGPVQSGPVQSGPVQSGQAWAPGDPAPDLSAYPVSEERPPDPEDSVR